MSDSGDKLQYPHSFSRVLTEAIVQSTGYQFGLGFSGYAELSDGRIAYHRPERARCDTCAALIGVDAVESEYDPPCDPEVGPNFMTSMRMCHSYALAAAIVRSGGKDAVEVRAQNFLLGFGIRAEVCVGRPGQGSLSISIRVNPTDRDKYNEDRNAKILVWRRAKAEQKIAEGKKELEELKSHFAPSEDEAAA